MAGHICEEHLIAVRDDREVVPEEVEDRTAAPAWRKERAVGRRGQQTEIPDNTVLLSRAAIEELAAVTCGRRELILPVQLEAEVVDVTEMLLRFEAHGCRPLHERPRLRPAARLQN